MSSIVELDTTTVSRSDAAPDSALPAVLVPHLFLALECERPLVPSACYPLGDLDEIVFGRDTQRGAFRSVEGGRRRLTVKVPDHRMSSLHARLERVLDRWVVEDCNSKNGVRLNGVRQRRAMLESGDLFELGHTLLLFALRTPTAVSPGGELSPSHFEPLVPGLSTFVPELARDFEALAQVARSTVPVVIQGETGTGKEVVARAIHALSQRPGPFVAVNSGALPETLIESELFGHRRGAFTGATEDRPGLIRSASGGTLFLDEIGDLPLSLQAAFLRVLQEGEVLPIGAAQPVKVDVRVLAATHRNLQALIEREQFRSDLYARICGFPLRLPPLRERREDLGILISALLPRVASDGGRGITFSCEAARALLAHRWPLNVRELEKALSVAAVLSQGGRVELEHLPAQVRGTPSGLIEPRGESLVPEPRPLPEAEAERRDHLIRLLREHRGNISAVAREMGLARMQIQRWLKRYRLDPQSFRA